MKEKVRIGQMLLDEGAISAGDLEKGLQIQQEIGGRLGAVFIRIGAVSEDVLLAALSEQLSLPVVGDKVSLPVITSVVDWCVTHNVEPDWLIDQQAIAWQHDSGLSEVMYAAKDPLAEPLVSALECVCPKVELIPMLISQQDLDGALSALGDADLLRGPSKTDAGYLKEMAEEAPVVELVNSIFSQAMDAGASDIHFEPEENSFKVRFRIDGILTTRLTYSREKFNAVASRVKLISNIDIAERRLPQDGSISTRASGEEVDIRVSTLPGVFGESIVMRLLPKDRKRLSMSNLGLLNDHLEQMSRWVVEPHGIVLVTGPTGSGKSTTLYTTLDEANDNIKKIITVEDPVEFKLQGITQVQTNSEIGLGFAGALRSILRQDPDIIMIGEIRDLETAEIAVQSALTGHLVFSTLHTNDSISAFTRLVEMGIEPFLVATPIIGAQAQRLVRRLCDHCKQPAITLHKEADGVAALSKTLGFEIAANWHDPNPEGCNACQGTGYKGRIGIYELVDVTPELQAMIVDQAPIADMYELVKSQGFRTLREDGLLKAMMGMTSAAEVIRVTRSRSIVEA